MKKNVIKISALLAAMLAASAVQAQMLPGSWSIGAGVTQISPNTKSGTLGAPSAPNTQIDVGSDSQPTLWVRGMFGDHWAVELPIGAGFKQKITGAGAIAGTGQIGTVKTLPVTLLGQYHFLERGSQIRPFASLGVTYAKVDSASGSAALSALNPANPPGSTTGLSIESKWAPVVGAGLTISINDKWYADVSYLRAFLKTTSRLSTGQSIDAKLDPDIFRIGVGYRF